MQRTDSTFPNIFPIKLWISGGLVVMFLTSLINYHFFNRYAYLLYGFTMILLILVAFIGRSAGGSPAMDSFGIFQRATFGDREDRCSRGTGRYFQDHQEKRTMGTVDLIVPAFDFHSSVSGAQAAGFRHWTDCAFSRRY
ncbi:MAG: hypothetical protein R2877_05805 [Bdellovibrionota bacterium]